MNKFRDQSTSMPPHEFQAFVQKNEQWFRGDITETEKTIQGIEESLGVRLPESLTWLLKEYGYGKATGILDLAESAKQTLYAWDRLELPTRYVLLRSDNKDFIVIDTSEETSPGEFAVYAGIDLEQLGPEIDLPPEARFDSFGELVEHNLAEGPLAFSSSPHDRLLVIATFASSSEAHVAKGRLAAEGIRGALDTEALLNMDWFLTNAVGGVKLLVFEKDAERAAAILDEADRRRFEGEEQVEEGEAESHRSRIQSRKSHQEAASADEYYDDEDEPTRREEEADRAYRAAGLGLVFIPLQFYVVWLLWKIVLSDERLARRQRRRALVAAAISFPIVGVCIWAIIRGEALSVFK